MLKNETMSQLIAFLGGVAVPTIFKGVFNMVETVFKEKREENLIDDDRVSNEIATFQSLYFAKVDIIKANIELELLWPPIPDSTQEIIRHYPSSELEGVELNIREVKRRFLTTKIKKRRNRKKRKQIEIDFEEIELLFEEIKSNAMLIGSKSQSFFDLHLSHIVDNNPYSADPGQITSAIVSQEGPIYFINEYRNNLIAESETNNSEMISIIEKFLKEQAKKTKEIFKTLNDMETMIIGLTKYK